jgi:hypothetical protein
MAIRKTGAVTGQVIGFGQDPEAEGITVTAAAADGDAPEPWTEPQEQALAAENQAADGE